MSERGSSNWLNPFNVAAAGVLTALVVPAIYHMITPDAEPSSGQMPSAISSVAPGPTAEVSLSESPSTSIEVSPTGVASTSLTELPTLTAEPTLNPSTSLPSETASPSPIPYPSDEVTPTNLQPNDGLPAVNAPIGGPVKGTLSIAAANIRSADTFAKNLGIISSNNPDFIALNEVSNESIPYMEQGAPGYNAYRNNSLDPGSGNRNDLGNALLWRSDTWNELDSGRLKITNHDYTVFEGKNVDWNRYAVWGVFERKSDEAIVSFIATHMMTNPAKYPRQWRETAPPMTRIEQYADSMHSLKQLIGVLALHGPVLVGGDMNAHPDDGYWAAVPQMEQAGYGYSDDEEVMYVFNPHGTKVVDNRVVMLDLHGDHDNKSVQTKIEMNGVGPGASTAR